MAEESLPILKKDRVSTGIRPLDIIMEGGYSHPSSILLMGPSGNEKQCFAAHFVKAGLDAGDTIIYITTDRSPDEIEKSASEWDLAFKGTGQMFYVDCYSQTAVRKEGMQHKENVSMVDGPGALNEISLMIGERLRENEGKRFRVVFHSLSTFALYNEKGSLFKFLQAMEVRMREANATLLILVEEGMHDEKFLTTLKHGIDDEFTIKSGEHEKTLNGERLPIPIPIKLGPLGIEVD